MVRETSSYEGWPVDVTPGAYLVLVGYALMILTWRRRTDHVDWVLLTFLMGMLLASSVHYFFGLHALVVGFVSPFR